MPKLRLAIIISILIIICWVPQSLAPTLQDHQAVSERTIIIDDIVNDFQLLSLLVRDISIYDQYLITNHAYNYDSAADYLAQGFDQILAQTIIAYYFIYVPELDQLAVVPIESIPIITFADEPYMEVHHLSPQKLVINRFYSDCYIHGDCYLYQITARFNGERWIIMDLSLNPAS